MLYLKSQCWAFYFPSRPVKCKHWGITKSRRPPKLHCGPVLVLLARRAGSCTARPACAAPHGLLPAVQLLAQLTGMRGNLVQLCVAPPATQLHQGSSASRWGTDEHGCQGGSVLRGQAVLSWPTWAHHVCVKRTKTPSVSKVLSLILSF